MPVSSTRTFEKFAIMGCAAVSLVASASPALASGGLPSVDGPVVGTAAYACDNGIEIDVNSVFADGLSAVAVSFPDGRSPNAAARQLLPRTQSGSGVRYASDLITFHMKSGEVQFEARASYLSKAIAPTQCELVGRRFDAPLTQHAQAGSYRYLSPLQSNDPTLPKTRRDAENICFVSDGSAAFVLAPFFQGRRAQFLRLSGSDRSVFSVDIGPVDASMSQRRYGLSDAQSGEGIGSLHYTARGAAEPGDVNAAARFGSVTLEAERSECMGLENALYTALTHRGIVQVNLKGANLEARIIRPSGGTTIMANGYVRMVGDAGQYWFFDGENRLKVDVSPGVRSDTVITLDNWTNQRLIPLAHFATSPRARPEEGVPNLDDDTAELIEDLLICNHIAGEASSDSQRGMQLSVIAGEAGCDTVPTRYANALSAGETDSPLQVFLIAHEPSWTPPS